MCFVITIGNPFTEVKAWGANAHKKVVEQVIKTRLTNVYFSNNELDLLYKCVILPDENIYRNPGGTYAGSLHGRNNYVATLKYVYELAFRYLQNQSKVEDGTFINNYLNQCDYLSAAEKKNLAIVNLQRLRCQRI